MAAPRTQREGPARGRTPSRTPLQCSGDPQGHCLPPTSSHHITRAQRPPGADPHGAPQRESPALGTPWATCAGAGDRATLGQAADTGEEILKHQHTKSTVTPGSHRLCFIYDWTQATGIVSARWPMKPEGGIKRTKVQAHSRPTSTDTAPLSPGRPFPWEARQGQLGCAPLRSAGACPRALLSCADLPGAPKHASVFPSLIPDRPGPGPTASGPSRTHGGGRCGLGVQPLPPRWGTGRAPPS